MDPDNPVYYSYNGILFEHRHDDEVLLLCPGGMRHCTIPSYASIYQYAFIYNYSLECIDVDPDNPFYKSYDGILFTKDFSQLLRCPPLLGGHIDLHNLPKSFTDILDNAFFGCSLTSVEIPNSVTSIGGNAFYGCSRLTSVEIPNSVTSIGENAFGSCRKLKSINVESQNTKFCSINGILFSKDLSEILQYPGGKKGDYKIPDNVTSIVGRAFSGCDSLTSVTIPNSVKKIGQSAFEKCNLLTSVEIPASVTRIEETIFWKCRSLTTVKIPRSVTYMSGNIVEYCPSMTTIDVDLDNPYYSSSDGVLFNKDLTTLIACPNGKNGDYEIPNSVQNIGFYAFFSCSKLSSVLIPGTVNNIESVSFRGCSSLKSVYYNTNKPFESKSSLFDYKTYGDATFYVPESAIETFKQTSPWMYFENIQGYNFAGIEDITAGFDETAPCEYFSLSGVKMGNVKEALAPGVYIVRQGDKAKKITVK